MLIQDLILVIGGAMGALVLRSAAKLAVKLRAERKPVAEYHCSDENVGPGGLSHGWGKKISDRSASNGSAWSSGENQVGPLRREHTIYGPYTNDFGKPGYYKVTFRVRCLTDLSPSNDSIVVLDVVRAPFSLEKGMVLIGQRVIRARELKRVYKYFNVYCYYAGGGIYEYRSSVNAKELLKTANSVLFDTIKVYRHFPTWDIF